MRDVLIFCLFAFLATTTCVQAQNAVPFNFETGFGLGPVPTFVKDRPHSSGMPLIVYADYRTSRLFSVGVFAGQSVSEAIRESANGGVSMNYKNAYNFVGARLAVHTDPHRYYRWEVYGGMNAFFARSKVTAVPVDKALQVVIKPETTVKRQLTACGFLGARYAMTKQLGIWGELGFGISIVSAGIGYRFTTEEK
jgi:hypothetical protein